MIKYFCERNESTDAVFPYFRRKNRIAADGSNFGVVLLECLPYVRCMYLVPGAGNTNNRYHHPEGNTIHARGGLMPASAHVYEKAC